MTGTLYAVGVGPGDPELMTLKAARIIRECQVIAIPHDDPIQCTAYQIAMGAVPEMKPSSLPKEEIPDPSGISRGLSESEIPESAVRVYAHIQIRMLLRSQGLPAGFRLLSFASLS